MIKIYITNQDNTKLAVDLIRYLKFKNDYYLIYTLNETDEKGYIKLYLVEIMEVLGEPISQNIKDDAEWASMKGIVKKIIKEIKSGKRKLLQDLDYHEIDGIKIENPRFFKLDKKLVDVLSSQYLEDKIDSVETTEESVVLLEETQPTQPIIPDSSLNVDQNLEPIVVEQFISTPVSPFNVNENTIVENIMDPVGNEDLEKTQILDINELQSQIEPAASFESTQTISPILKEDSKEVPILHLENEEQPILNYEELYREALKAKDATNSMLLNTLKQLQKYQNKYGKLED